MIQTSGCHPLTDPAELIVIDLSGAHLLGRLDDRRAGRDRDKFQRTASTSRSSG